MCASIPSGVMTVRYGPPYVENLRLVAVTEGEDPVALASSRNRTLYVLLLILFYGTLAIGVVLTGRALYREAPLPHGNP